MGEPILRAQNKAISGELAYSSVVLSSRTEISKLTGMARRLVSQLDEMLEPEFFLASISEEWIPRVVVNALRKLCGGVA